MDKIKKDYLVEKYKNALNREDLKKFEEGLDQSSEHALSNLLDLKLKDRLTTFLLSFFLGPFSAGRFYLGDKKLGALKLIPTILTLIGVILFIVGLRLFFQEVAIQEDLITTSLTLQRIWKLIISSLILGIVFFWVMIIWSIVDIFLCNERAKFLNREKLLSSAFAQPGPDTETTKNYHTDTYKTICFYEKFKNEIPDLDKEKFKSAVYYVDDRAFENVETLKLKSRDTTLLLSIFLGLFCVGSFYLGNYKRAIIQIIINVLLFIGCNFILAFVPTAGAFLFLLFVALLIFIYRWGSEIDMCCHYVKVVNGRKILDTLREYRNNQINLA